MASSVRTMIQNPIIMMRCGPHCRADEIDGQVLQNEFHQMFRKTPEKKKNKKKKILKGKDKKRKMDTVEKQPTPFLEIRSNPSAFALFACVRQCVLDKQVQDATHLYLRTSVGRISSDTDSDDEETEKAKEVAIKVPKVVGIGLCSVFELIKESRKRHPSLCTRALQALLDMLQGQQPEGLKAEPPDVIDALFDLLLEIACSSPAATEPSPSSSTSLLTSYAAACLVSLVVARGDTGKMLSAAAAMLMSPRSHAAEEIPTPSIVTSLQRSVHAVFLGKTIRPDWLTHGIPKSSLCDSFYLQIPKSKNIASLSASSDGKYLYLLCSGSLYKLGTGFGGTIKGQMVSSRGGLQDGAWLGYAKGYLYLHLNSGQNNELVKVDRETLKEKEFVQLDVTEWGPSAYFSDGEHLGLITAGKDDSFLVRTFKTNVSPMPCVHELALKLARKSLEVFGSGIFDEESTFHAVSFPLSEDEPTGLACGKDFALLRTTSGKMLVSGKPQSLGIKQGARVGKWTDVPITKSPKILQFSVGHEGLHALLVSEDGGVFFSGLARRGEDGDQTKGRRQPKPVKPKKMIKMEGQRIIGSACNNGTSALVTQEGELYLFGKDSSHADHNTGLVTDLKDAIITQVALGKAHVVALSNKGQVYTFGINHKGQCGREFSHGSLNKEVVHPVAMATAPEEEGEEEEGESEEQDVMCPPGKHRWKHDQCMVCSLCGECTGYGAGCIASGRPERNPGQACGCGAGDSGCSDCGCCRTCAKDGDVFADWDPLAAGGLLDNKQSDVIVFDIRYGGQSKGRAGARLEDRIRRRMEEYRIRQRRKQMLQSLKVIKGQGGSPLRNSCSAKLQDLQDKSSVASADENFLSDHEKENTKCLTSLSPARLFVPCDSPVVQVACGMHHTVLLMVNGDVFTFGSNQHGQLGLGDFALRGAPEQIKMVTAVTQVAAGSNHTVLLSVQGQVFTFGSYQRGQLGRVSSGEKEGPSWHAVPAPVPQIGAKQGRRATWIGASADQTFVKIDESLISSHSLSRSSVVAGRNCIGILPISSDQISPFKCLMINKVDGTCRSFNTPEQVELNNCATCLDSTYNIIWSFDPVAHRVSRYNIVASEARLLPALPVEGDSHPLPSFLGPELAVPGGGNATVGRSHAALHLLGCLDILTAASEQGLVVRDHEDERQNLCKAYAKEDFSVVNRFESHGGGWGYSGHSIEAVRFMADTDVLLGGFGLFGGRGEYTAKLKLFDIGTEGGEQETDGELVAETEEIPYECGARQKYPMLFDEPISLQANRWYVAWSRISGPSSDCGSSGQSVVTTEEQVVFYFKSSKKSNNGTDVNAGQIPQLLYRAVMPDSHSSDQPSCLPEQVCILSREFSRCVSPDCFHSLLKLLRWSWQTFKAALCEASVSSPPAASLLDLEKLMYISCASLHLLRIYVNEIYPNGPRRNFGESQKLAECVGDCCALLRHILADQVPPTLPHMLRTVTEECHRTFLACYHAFYPSSALKWRGLCDLLLTVDVPWVKGGPESDHLLAAVLTSLCSPSVRLTSILPVPSDRDLSCEASQLSSPPESSAPDTSPAGQEMSGHCLEQQQQQQQQQQQHRYPLLVEVMTQRSEREGCHTGPCAFREVLDRLLAIVLQPVKALLREDEVCHSSKLVASTSALLATLVAEISSQTVGTVLDLQGSGATLLHNTPSRFTRISQNRTWNTGNGSPDAICFSVDRSGILVAGACIYGGAGNEWHYELELLDDSGSSVDPSHTQRWKTLEIVRGTFGPDDCYSDVAEIKFERPVAVKENIKYALRLRNHGARTNNGDGGLAQVKGPDGTIFTFSDCSLSFNGTNHTRGQVPQILYYSTPQDSELQQSYKDMAEVQARRNALTIGRAIVRAAAELFMEAQAQEDEAVLCSVGSSHLVTMLLPLVLAHMGPLATSDPRSAVQVLGMVRDLLPLVATLNKRSFVLKSSDQTSAEGTTSTHYAVVESDHPYRPATVSNYKVVFPNNVRWMSLEFDPCCGTSQCEDSLQLYIPCTSGFLASSCSEEDSYSPYWPVLRKFGGSVDWPHSSLVLPGNEVLFSLETASDYVKDEHSRSYGFRCQLVGFECIQLGGLGLVHLERELAYLGGMCAASLMRRDLLLPPVSVMEMEEDLDLIEESAQQVYSSHVQLLSKGFSMAHPATIHQALEGILPFSTQSNERPFLKDFVSCTAGTSGGRLARWLQPEPYVDPKQCELLCSQDELKCGWPAVITVITKDQYGNVVTCPALKVEVKAVPLTAFDKEGGDVGRKLMKTSKPDTGSLTFGGHPAPSLEAPYEITVKDKMFYYAITMMKAYENYSFEELRYVSPTKKRLIENMLVRSNADGTHTANWTPGSVGWYILRATVDGFEMGGSQLRSVEVKEPPQGMLMPSKNPSQKNCHQPSKVRRFQAKYSAGLRIRSHPSLQSEQIGIVHVNGTITFMDELHNDDGVWLRLSPETVKKYCHNGYIEAWCLQYNQHLGKTLLIPLEEPKSVLSDFFRDTGHFAKKRVPLEEVSPKDQNKLKRGQDSATNVPLYVMKQSTPSAGPGVYHVVRCGASGHNVRSRPSLKAPPVGMLILGNTVGIVEDISNADGVWVKLDRDGMRRFCFNGDGEAWSLAQSRSEITYLQHEAEMMQAGDSDEEYQSTTTTDGRRCSSPFAIIKKGYDFGASVGLGQQPSAGFGHSPGLFSFGSDQEGGSSGSASPFVFGSPASTPSTSMHTIADSEPTDRSDQVCRVVTVQQRLREDKGGGGGSDCYRSSLSRDVPPELQGVSVRELVKAMGESRFNGNAATPPQTPSSTPPLPRRQVRGSNKLTNGEAKQEAWAPKSPLRRNSLQSESSVGSQLSSILKELSQTSATGCIGCMTQRNTISPISTPGTPKKEAPSGSPGKSVTQAGTQTSPPEGLVKGHFSIGSKEERLRISPKTSRKERRQLRSGKRSNSPHEPKTGSLGSGASKEQVQEAMAPSVAECLRAVFAAFLWHEGIVYDAMACASFLKFNPNLPKNSARVPCHAAPFSGPLTKEEKARLRHSVEVAPGLLNLEQMAPLNANIVKSSKKADEGENSSPPCLSDLPHSLRHLVYLWEQISTACMKAVVQQLILPSPAAAVGSRRHQRTGCEKRPKRRKDQHKSVSLFGEAERETSCELCGQFFSHPVTYHMRSAHPGCGDHAGGKGYNSGGNFCGGWAGNCGDGGIGGSSWYLICDRCREKYLRQKRQNVMRERARKNRKKCSSVRMLSPLPATEEAHHVMKNNAMFLLELSSATRGSLSSQLASEGSMPSVLEQEDAAEGPFPVGPFQCLQSLGCEPNHHEGDFLSEEEIRALQQGNDDLPRVGGKQERRRPRKDGEGSRSFHRSISVGLTSREWNRQEGEGLMEGRVVMMRKRNSSGSEDGSSSFLCQPSTALTKLVALANERLGSAVDFTLQRPVMIFLLQRHDLERLQLAMCQALRKASCRVYGMQALNWLLRGVTQPISLHDLLWWFVAALAPNVAEHRGEEEEVDTTERRTDHEEQDQNVCEHPLADITVAGEAVHPLRQTFHSLLQTISDLMAVLPVGSSLQQMAMRCWCLRFMPQDHAFLHGSHVFSNISKILSKSEEEGGSCLSEEGQHEPIPGKITSRVECLKDVTLQTEIRASSRQAMVGSLTDGSTETFWESGDEDRNKSKSLLILCSPPVGPKVVYVHIDNCRDLANKVSSIAFRSGNSSEELQKLKQVEVESRYTGWIGCFLPDTTHMCIRLELKGPDNTLRLRQVKLLGKDGGTITGKDGSAAEIQQKNCEAETLKVFRLLTSQVFGKLVSGGEIEGEDEVEASNDLKEHMVGILFSGSKLTHLQKQVCAHIVAAIRKEAQHLREEWEALLCSRAVSDVPKSSDAYCFEMLSMVLALSGSGVGRTYLAQQAGLLRDLFSLLHTGSARVQRQVTSLLRRVLPEVPPQVLAAILEVPELPPSDFSIVSSDPLQRPFDPHATGILDVFLACIAKALTVQTKVKGGSVAKGVTTVTLATSIHPRDYVGARWWLRGCMARKLSQVIIQLLKDMATGKLTEAWATVTKGAIAENILNLTKMDEHYRRTPAECLRTPTLWLALASLCVLDQEHVERLSSGQWVGCGGEGQQANPRPKCDNHDDDETPAIILCNSCGNLCADCDRFLHLHRRTRSHQRQVFKEEEEAIRVDLHEGCGRTKLFWVMALADSRTLKAMVEFREGTRGKGAPSSGVCRFCGATGGMGLLAIGNVCGEPECQEHARNACSKLLSCGHPCGGIRSETPCLPCLQGCCGEGSGLKQDADDMCMICFTESLACAPALQLFCGHVFHLHCCRAVLARRWLGPRITFGFSLCPICKAPMNHLVLKDLLEPVRGLYEDVRRKAQMRLEYEGLLKAEAITVPGARFYNDPAGFAMERYAYYVCYKCKKAYYGGEARCDVEAGQGEDYDPTELVCGACSDISRAQMCPKHGTDFLEYKCRYCCSVAVFFCFGTTHFCNACHDDFQRVTNIPKTDLPHCPAGPKAKQMEGEECPLHVKHPPTGEEFALGCGVCRNAHTF